MTFTELKQRDPTVYLEKVGANPKASRNSSISCRGIYREDKNPSVDWNCKDSVWLWTDRAEKCGGTILDYELRRNGARNVAEAAQSICEILGLLWNKNEAPYKSAKKPPAASQKLEKRGHTYTDADGNKIFQILIEKLPNGKKKIRQRQPDPSNPEKWIWNLEGLPRPLPLYRLHELAAAPLEKEVWLVEGEKDVDSLTKLGEIATCNAGGAGKWHTDYNELFKGRHVIIAPDNDEAGKKHAELVVENLTPVTTSLKIIDWQKIWPDMPEKADITDALQDGLTLQQIQAAALPYQAQANQEKAHRPHEPNSLLDAITPVDFGELAENYFGQSFTDKEGEPRSANQKESHVLIIQHLLETARDCDGGFALQNLIPYIYKKTHWHTLEADRFERILGKVAERMGLPPAEARHFHTRKQLMDQFKTSAPFLEQKQDYTTLNFQNGTLHIDREGETLKPHNRADALTYVLPFDYEPQADGSQFARYLSRVLPDRNSQRVLAEFFGWIFLPDLKLEKVLILYGDGHNGKSVMADIMHALLGEENISSASLGTLSKLENRPLLTGKLLNFGSEISTGINQDLFKKLASGEPVEARRLYSDTFTMKNYAKLAFNANTLPKETEATEGFFRRFLIIPFEETITAEEKDPDLAQKIIASELPGIMNWIIRGLRRLREQRKFSECPASERTLSTYREESDSTALFLKEEAWKTSLEGTITKALLYDKYRDYCRDSGCQALSKRNFGDRLKRVHQIKDGKSGSTGHYWKLSQNGEQ